MENSCFVILFIYFQKQNKIYCGNFIFFNTEMKFWNDTSPPPPHIKIYMQLNVMLTEKILLVWPT